MGPDWQSMKTRFLWLTRRLLLYVNRFPLSLTISGALSRNAVVYKSHASYSSVSIFSLSSVQDSRLQLVHIMTSRVLRPRPLVSIYHIFHLELARLIIVIRYQKALLWMYPLYLRRRRRVIALTWYATSNSMHRSNDVPKDLTLVRSPGTPVAKSESPGAQFNTQIDGMNALLDVANGLFLLHFITLYLYPYSRWSSRRG
jgi:hypothetical protein